MNGVNDSEPNLRITVIGEHRREFLPVMKTVTELPQSHRLFWYQTIEEALEDGGEGVDDADLVIVFQSYSDQFSRETVNSLVGRTIFGRLLCCYGPWCESDGRNRDFWPDAVRVPLRLESGIIQREVDGILRGSEPLPPTAARDEIFAHRLTCSDKPTTLETGTILNATIISSDRILRNVLAAALKQLGIRSVTMPPIVKRPTDPVDRKQSSAGPIHLVIHDLDPWGPLIADSVRTASQMFPSADVFGIATMPDAGLATEIADETLHSVIPKLDLELGLRHHLQDWCRTRSSGRLRKLNAVPA